MRDFVRMPPQAGRKPPAAQHRPALKTAKPTTGFAAQRTGQLVRHPEISPAPPSRDIWRAATAGAAAPLPHRGTMERLFGRAFSGVRAYFGRSAPLNALGAKAATDGERVAFASNAPSRRQVAHELAHVVQMRQGGGTADGSRLSRPGSPAEREADRIAERAGRGEPVSVAEAAPATLHRDIKKDQLEVPHGHFKIDMTKVEVAGGKSGEEGYIHYKPKPDAPESASIRLTQIVQDTKMTTGPEPRWENYEWKDSSKPSLGKMQTAIGDRVHKTVAGQTLASISLYHFGTADQAEKIKTHNELLIKASAPKALTDMNAPLPAGLALEICDTVQAGFFVDHSPQLPDAVTRKAASDPVVVQDYMRPNSRFMDAPNQHGTKKKGKTPTEAVIYDFPGTEAATHFRWNFETVARSDDIGLYYGTLSWRFELDSTGAAPKVSNEAYSVTPGVTDTFRSAVVEFNRFYANPHIVMKGQTLWEISRLYFGKPDRADDIFKANEKLIGKRDSPLQIGWSLRIPDLTDSLKKP